MGLGNYSQKTLTTGNIMFKKIALTSLVLIATTTRQWLLLGSSVLVLFIKSQLMAGRHFPQFHLETVSVPTKEYFAGLVISPSGILA